MSTLRLKRVLVTGAARGIGKAIAGRFAAAGAEVVITDLDAAALEAARDDVAGARQNGAGAICRAYPLDVTDAEAVHAVRDRLHAEAGRIDVLVNNAGVVHGGAFLDVPLERHRATYRVNVEGVMTMTHAFLPDLIAAPRGHLVNLASAAGFIGLPNGATYASSKWAVIGLTESIRLELKRLGHRNVDVTTVCPTYVATGMFEGARPPRTTQPMTADQLAERIVEAVEHRKVWVLEPWIVKITPMLKSCLPTPVSDFLSDALGASGSMDNWRGHAAR